MAVRLEVSACSAMAEKAGRSSWNLPTSSAVRCCASAAEPPLPAASTRPPAPRRVARDGGALVMVHAVALRAVVFLFGPPSTIARPEQAPARAETFGEGRAPP